MDNGELIRKKNNRLELESNKNDLRRNKELSAYELYVLDALND